MRSVAVIFALGLTVAAACSDGTPIKDLPDKNVSKKAREWKDPGAKADVAIDAADAGGSEDAGEIEFDAGMRDAGTRDAGVSDGGQ